MITSIKVDGFRSLTHFYLDIRPGLNILVGPNGSGKTNIISFFEFISHLVNCGPAESINRLGGAGNVFTKLAEQLFQRQMEVQIRGCITEGTSKYIQYEYEFIIEAAESLDNIKFTKQSLKIKYVKKYAIPNDNIKSAFTISQELIKNKHYMYTLTNLTDKYIDAPFLSSKSRINSKFLETFLNNNMDEDSPLVLIMSILVRSASQIILDLRGGQVFNIIPSRVRNPEESSNSPGIQKDGSGLAATLYAIKNKKIEPHRFRFSSHFIIRRSNPEVRLRRTTLQDILKYLITANPAIKDIDVQNDVFDNLLKVRFSVEKDNHLAVLPLSSMSDGTIKWLSLVTAVLTSPSIFSLEEPENFLHPLIQSEVVKLMRSASQNSSSIIMSTHSETILNSAEPEEIVIVRFNEGRTEAKRCTNAAEIKSEIEQTGFGLGYYYISGSISDE